MNRVLSFLVILVSTIFMMVEFNLFNSLNRMYDAVEFRAFLADSANADSLKGVIKKYRGVIKIKFISKNEALSEFNKNFKYSEYFLNSVAENPFPASLRIILANHYKTPDYIERLSSKISKLSGVARVNYSKEWLQTICIINEYFKWLSMGCGGLLFCFLIFMLILDINHLRITCKDEIKLLKEFGISQGKLKLRFGRQVFLWDILFALVSIGLVYCGYRFGIVKYSIGTTFITTFLPMFFLIGFVGVIGVLALILLFVHKI